MIRAVEVMLFLAPAAVFVLWLYFGTAWFVPRRTALLALLGGLIIIGAGLAWTGLRERHPEGSRYVPAQLNGGRIVPGHGV